MKLQIPKSLEIRIFYDQQAECWFGTCDEFRNILVHGLDSTDVFNNLCIALDHTLVSEDLRVFWDRQKYAVDDKSRTGSNDFSDFTLRLDVVAGNLSDVQDNSSKISA